MGLHYNHIKLSDQILHRYNFKVSMYITVKKKKKKWTQRYNVHQELIRLICYLCTCIYRNALKFLIYSIVGLKEDVVGMANSVT